MKICHVSSAHSRYDTRIFLKECTSLARKYSVVYIVSDGNGNETKNGVRIVDAGTKPKNKVYRFLSTTYHVYREALKQKAIIYHLHDPEMMLYALLLKWSGKKVIYDIHEFFPLQILSKEYIPIYLRKATSSFFAFLEKFVASRVSAVITALFPLEEKFKKYNKQVATINNYPFINELSLSELPGKPKSEAIVTFVGLINKIRGLHYVIQSLEKTEATFKLAGNFNDPAFKKECESLPGWQQTDYLGQINRQELASLLAGSTAGIVTYLDAPNHTNAQPTKLFEYMSAGIAVIASDFPLWKSIVEQNHCGICVEPTDTQGISNAINKLVNNQELASEMGQNGRNAILDRYNWESEEKKLLDLYNIILTS